LISKWRAFKPKAYMNAWTLVYASSTHIRYSTKLKQVQGPGAKSKNNATNTTTGCDALGKTCS